IPETSWGVDWYLLMGLLRVWASSSSTGACDRARWGRRASSRPAKGGHPGPARKSDLPRPHPGPNNASHEQDHL
ncbi:MAG: hypothetical protein KDA28_12225, partial [Phycisphaerales bacterium]|nr:hypothetical protein [Phycisphaerales bacterium]